MTNIPAKGDDAKETEATKARDTTDAVNEFLEKDKEMLDDPKLSQGLVNLASLSLSPIQTL